MIFNARHHCVCILLSGVMCCSPNRPRDVVSLLAGSGSNLLDSSQAYSVFSAMQYFPNETQLAIGLIIGDSIRYVGVKRQNDSLVYVQNSCSAFEIGSVTKTLTATMLAKLVYDGEVDLNEPIKNILPVRLHQSALHSKEITLLHLANHTSGIPKEPDNITTDWAIPGSPYKAYDEIKLYDYLTNRLTLQFTPGEKREYSNLGGGLLGHLLTLRTGKTYEALLLEYICGPLGMTRTFVTIDSARMKYLVPGRHPQGGIVPNWELNVLTGGGGIKSTAVDLAKYLRAQMTDTTYFFLTQQPTIQYTEHNTAGLGWAWYSEGNRRFVDATGGTGGYSCIVIFERSTRTAVILLTNVSAFLASKGDYISKLGIRLHNSLSVKE
ncbi:MAG: serine hydrolase domain-containing protein [Bacteroidota bacterium]